MRNLITSGALVITGMLTGCANVATANFYPDEDLLKEDVLFVERLEADERGIHTLIANNFASRGWSATAGEKDNAPKDTTVLVSYIDRWMWDITMYMLELTITLTDAKTGSAMASGNSMHTSLTRKSPEKMVDEVIGNIIEADQQN